MTAASITVRRELEWMDTDAAGIWHYTAALRFIEHAEHQLHRHLGIEQQIVGRAPRVRVEIDFMAPVRFPDEVATTLTVAEVRNSAIRYEAFLEGPAGVVARGAVTCVLVESIGGRPRRISDEVRAALATGESR